MASNEGKPIDGPYKFGDQPPAHLMGWAGVAVGLEAVRREIGRIAHCLVPAAEIVRQAFAGPAAEPPKVITTYGRPHAWDAGKAVNGGKHLPTFYQEDGDCVAAGARHGLMYRIAEQMAIAGQEQKFRYPFAPWIYGTSRADVGGGQLGRSAGSLGSWAAAALLKYGIIWEDDPNVPAYSLAVSKAWGLRPPKECYPLAVDNLVKRAAQLTAVEEIKAALQTSPIRRVVTIASNQGWAMQPETYKGFHCFRPSGSFAHQTVLLEWMTDPFEAAYRLNSWGPDAHGTPLNGEPPGGAWWRTDHLARELKQNSVECFAYELVDADAGPPDPGIL